MIVFASKKKNILRGIVSLCLIVGGSTVWSSRLSSFKPDERVGIFLSEKVRYVSAEQKLDLSKDCALAETENGWVLFFLRANLINDNRFRRYFESAEEPIGLFVEYDYGLLRLGLGLGTDNPVSNKSLSIRTVRQPETTEIFIGVTRDETRVVTNATDKSTPWLNEFSGWSCDSVQFGDDDTRLSTGDNCEECSVTLGYASGTDTAELDAVLDKVSNLRDFNVRRWMGTLLILVGIFGLIIPSSRAYRSS
jgi:hypothetical protein